MSSLLRRLVSKQKRRYQHDGFDLDLAFIDVAPHFKGRLLAMAFPTDGKEAWYRNHYKDVRRFLQHCKLKGQGSFKVYNLTAERPAYLPERLGGELANFPFNDHQVPSLAQMQAFCDDLSQFLECHPDNFAAVHCKAGKGRTGVMICAYLLHAKLADSAAEALEIYGRERSLNFSGITVASQKRYVEYFETVAREQRIPEAPGLVFRSISVAGLPKQQLANIMVVVSERCPDTNTMKCLASVTASREDVHQRSGDKNQPSDALVKLILPANWGHPSTGACVVRGDMRIEVYNGRAIPSKLLFRAFLNTAFISTEEIVLNASELDKGASAVPAHAQVTLHLENGRGKFQGSQAEALKWQPHSVSPEPQPFLDGETGSRPASQQQEPYFPSLLDVHPDFSIPTNYYPTLEAELGTPPATAPSVFATIAAQQLHSADESSSVSSTDGSSGHGRRSRMEALDQDLKVLENRRSQSEPVSWTDYLPLIRPIPRSISLAKLRVERKSSKLLGEDPELSDYSAPTTPSLPRPFTSIDWQYGSSVALDCLHQRDSSGETKWASGFAPGNHVLEAPASPTQEPSASQPDSPSRGAQIIKWMSSSWWLNMA